MPEEQTKASAWCCLIRSALFTQQLEKQGETWQKRYWMLGTVAEGFSWLTLWPTSGIERRQGGGKGLQEIEILTISLWLDFQVAD